MPLSFLGFSNSNFEVDVFQTIGNLSIESGDLRKDEKNQKGLKKSKISMS